MRIFVTGATGFAGSAQTQQQPGWRPAEAPLIPDIDRPAYFERDREEGATQ